MWRRAAWPAFVLIHKIAEYSKSFWTEGKKTTPQENNIPLGSLRRRAGHSTLKFDDAIYEEDAIGG